MTFATPGDLAVTYSTQLGLYTRVSQLVVVSFQIATSSFTFATSSGGLIVTGLPFTVKNDAVGSYGPFEFSGITKAGYTMAICNAAPGSTRIDFRMAGSGVSSTTVKAADTPSGGTLVLNGTVTYVIA